MEILTQTLYWISTGLMIPVVLLLIVMFIKSLLVVGRFYGDYINKMKFNKELNARLKEVNQQSVLDQIDPSSFSTQSTLIPSFELIRNNHDSKAHCEKSLADYEILADKDLGQSKTLTKLGPMLGLMGTLIPMGPALVGLASGDIASMAQNMQVAFATTVVGILIGAIGFITLQIKQRWYAEDLNHLEFIVELINSKKS